MKKKISLALVSQVIHSLSSSVPTNPTGGQKKERKNDSSCDGDAAKDKSGDVCTDVILQFKPEGRREVVEIIKKL